MITDEAGGNHLTLLAQEHLVQGSPWYPGPYQDTAADRGFMTAVKR